MSIATRYTLVGFLTLLLLGTAPLASAQRNDILVVPARARMVRLGFDMQALRGVALLSYRETDDPLQPLVHVWNRSRRDWQRVDLANLARTPGLPATPQNVFVIGPAAIVPEILMVSLAHATEVHTLQTFSVAEILTQLNQTMAFDLDEWRALAQRYDLEITELHHERNRWGRFGPPRRYREQMEQEARQRILEAPYTAPDEPIAVEPVREIRPVVTPELAPQSPEPVPAVPETITAPPKDQPEAQVDLFETDDLDETMAPEQRMLDTMQIPDRGMDTVPETEIAEEAFPIK